MSKSYSFLVMDTLRGKIKLQWFFNNFFVHSKLSRTKLLQLLTKFLRKLSTFPARSFLFEIPPIRARKSSDHVSNSRATVRRKKRIVPVGASFKVRRTADLKVVCPVHTQSSKFNYPNSRASEWRWNRSTSERRRRPVVFASRAP